MTTNSETYATPYGEDEGPSAALQGALERLERVHIKVDDDDLTEAITLILRAKDWIDGRVLRERGI
jgi:hypothetical protein